MKRVTITCSNGPVELSESVEDLYSVSEKANSALKELRMGLPTWTAKETYNKMQVSLWIYDNIEVNAFCHYEDTEKGVQHLMNLHNGWQELVDYYNQYTYIPIEKMERIDGLLASLDESGSFIRQ